MKIRGKLLLSPHTWNDDWGFLAFLFFSGLLHYYRIQLHHLTPNSFVHISIFVHLCEAFLGIEPHFQLFHYLFHLKPQPNRFVLDVVGGAGLQLRQRRDTVHIPYDLSNKVIEWKPKWFYVKNQSRSFHPLLPDLQSNGPSGIKNQSMRVKSLNYSIGLPF